MKERNLKIKNDLAEISAVVEEIDKLGEQWGLTEKLKFNLNLAIEELVTNTISYGYNDDTEHEISITFYLEKDSLKLKIEDEAFAFNPLEQDSPEDLNKPVEEKQIGGLGIHLVKNIMDNIEYQRKDNLNILTLTKKFN